MCLTYVCQLQIFVNGKALTYLDLADIVRLVATIGDNIKRVRRRHKPLVTQEELADRIGHASNANISTWERTNQIPEEETIKRLAKALHCETWEFYVGVEMPHDALRRRPGDVDAVERVGKEVLEISHRKDRRAKR